MIWCILHILTSVDIKKLSLTIQSPKSGRVGETVYAPRKILVKLTTYVKSRNIASNDRIFPISYRITSYNVCYTKLLRYEAEGRIGGHTHTVMVEQGDEKVWVDTGFIVCNDRTYPQFLALMDRLGVDRRPTEMSFSVRNDGEGLEYNA